MTSIAPLWAIICRRPMVLICLLTTASLAAAAAAWILSGAEVQTSARRLAHVFALGLAAVLGLYAHHATRHGLKAAHEGRQAINALREREEQLQSALEEAARARDSFFSIINTTSDGLLLLDNNFCAQAANRRCAELFGIEYRQLLTWSREELTTNIERRVEDTLAHREKLARHFARPEDVHQDHLTLLQPVKRVLRRSSCPAWHQGRVVGRVFTYTDVTREAELDQMKSDFVSMASHELRTPLTSIRGALQLAYAGSADRMTPEDRELFEISLASTERLGRLVNRMLDLSKLEAGRMPLDIKRLNAATLLEETAGAMQGHASTKQIDIVVSCQSQLDLLDGDQDLLLRVLSNLVSNALKYSPNESCVRLSAVRASDVRDAIEFRVEDEGPGIAPDERARLFQAFQRVGAQQRDRRDGTGLGLAISRAILEQHEGRIWVESGPNGVGTRFAFVIPCQRRQAALSGRSAVA